METLLKQVRRAERRLLWQRMAHAVCWCWFGAFLVAALLVGVDRFWPLGISASWWIASAAFIGPVLAGVWTVAHRRGAMEAAIEMDQRFGLKERVSSTVAMGEAERESPAGRALLDDALRRTKRLNVESRFGISLRPWRPLTAVAPALIVLLLLLFVDQVIPETPASASEDEVTQRNQIRRSSDELRKKIARQRKRAEEQNLKDLQGPLIKLEEELERLSKAEKVDKKKALIKLSDLAEDLKKRRRQRGGVDQIRKQLQGLSNKQQGPGKRMAAALKDGDFQKAAAEVQKLREKLAKGELDEKQKQQLEKQLQDVQNKLNQAADAHQKATEDLQKKIDQLNKSGKAAEANELQKKLDQLRGQAPQMEQLRQMADKLGQCRDAMKQGQGEAAAQQLDELQQQLDQLQQEAEAMEVLDQSLEQIARAKDSMACKQCGGAGCKACQGQGQGNKQGQPGNGLGEGRGEGARPEAKNDAAFRDSRIRPPIHKGQALVIGRTGGANVKGKMQTAIQSEVRQARQSRDNPLSGQTLPRGQREHAQEYFDSIRQPQR
jgi:hypothetical protein